MAEDKDRARPKADKGAASSQNSETITVTIEGANPTPNQRTEIRQCIADVLGVEPTGVILSG